MKTYTIPADEEILALIDCTKHGAAEHTVVFGSLRIYYRYFSYFWWTNSIPYELCRDSRPWIDRNGHIDIKTNAIDLQDADVNAQDVVRALLEIAALFQKKAERM